MEAILGADLAHFQALISQLMSAANAQRSQAESFFNLSRERHPDALALKLAPLLPKVLKEEKLVFLASLRLTLQCSSGVCKNALKKGDLQFAIKLDMTMEVGDDELPMPLPRPPPEPPPEPPPRT